jgi:hypothetical protein
MNTLLKFILFSFISAVSSNLLAQGLVDPGVDPLTKSNNINEKVRVPLDSISNQKTDTSKVLTFRNSIEAGFLQPSSAETEFYYVDSKKSINKKSFSIRNVFFYNSVFKIPFTRSAITGTATL